MSAYTQSPRTRGEVTIVEIILILLVLAVAAALLFPVFARPTHGGARRSTCQSNLKECAIALQTYWADYDGTLPSSALVSHSKTWNRRDFVTFATRRGAIQPDPKGHLKTWPELLYRYMQSKDILFCPSDDADQQDPKSRVSYYWKAAIDKAWMDPAIKCRAESDFGYNADQIVLYERCGFHSGASQGLKNGIQINVAYLDTHVKSACIVNSARDENSTTYVTSCTAKGEPAYFNFDNNQAKDYGVNPPTTATTFYDPRQYSDMLP